MEPDASLSFPYFAKFPQEIQDMIWEAAILNRYFEPEAHFVNVENPAFHIQHDTRPGIFTQSWSGWTSSLAVGPPLNISHEIPAGFKPDGTPYKLNLDAGLWLACVVSRQAVVRHWENVYTPKGDHKPGLLDVSIVRVRGSYGNLRSEVSMVLRANDLLICHVPKLESFAGYELSQAIGAWDTKHAPIHTEYLAVHIERSWRSKIQKYRSLEGLLRQPTRLGSLARQIQHLRSKHNITRCLIERDFKPKSGVTYQELVQGHKVFLAQGRRYVLFNSWPSGRKWRDFSKRY